MKARATDGKITYVQAALRVLEESKRPMTGREILDEASVKCLIVPGGKTPAATLISKLYTLMKSDSSSPIVKLSEPGNRRARRGSVRWALKSGLALVSQGDDA